MSAQVTTTSRAREASEGMTVGALAALNTVGLMVQTESRKRTPVDTGRLRSSIAYEVSQPTLSVVVGTNVEYAGAVHERTDVSHTVGQAKFLENAANFLANRIARTLGFEIEQRIDGAVARAKGEVSTFGRLIQ